MSARVQTIKKQDSSNYFSMILSMKTTAQGTAREVEVVSKVAQDFEAEGGEVSNEVAVESDVEAVGFGVVAEPATIVH